MKAIDAHYGTFFKLPGGVVVFRLQHLRDDGETFSALPVGHTYGAGKFNPVQRTVITLNKDDEIIPVTLKCEVSK